MFTDMGSTVLIISSLHAVLIMKGLDVLSTDSTVSIPMHAQCTLLNIVLNNIMCG